MSQPSTCNCTTDGFCQRFQRPMGGRFREICAGVNVDLGTAAAFREQWGREAEMVRPTPNGDPPRRLVLRTYQNPGDALVMTAAIHSLHKVHPGKYQTAVDSPWPEVFAHNPDVSPVLPGADLVQMHYPAIHQSNDRAIHFMQGWCEHLSAALGVPVPLMTNRPRLFFSSREAFAQEDYWLICSGGKRDFTNKLWGHHNYQEVVDRIHGRVRFIQVGAGKDDHPRLRGTENMVGKTTLRGLFSLARRSRGIVCGVSLLMHVAAALEKPAVVVAGGREPVAWNAYPRQQYLHTVGALPCTDTKGHTGEACWRSRTIPLGDGMADGLFDRDPCERSVEGQPMCMTLIKPAQVAELVLRYTNVGARDAEASRKSAATVVPPV